jgi:hypothetical protein
MSSYSILIAFTPAFKAAAFLAGGAGAGADVV